MTSHRQKTVAPTRPSLNGAPYMTRLNVWANVALTGFFALVTLHAISNILPAERFEWTLQYLRESNGAGGINADDYNIFFVGSSLVEWNILPTVFDERLRERGFGGAKSFALGIPAYNGHGINKLLRDLYEMKPERMSIAFLDANRSPSPIIAKQEQGSSRAIYWHDLPETLSVLKILKESDYPLLTKTKAARDHLQHFLKKHVPYHDVYGVVSRHLLGNGHFYAQEHRVVIKRRRGNLAPWARYPRNGMSPRTLPKEDLLAWREAVARTKSERHEKHKVGPGTVEFVKGQMEEAETRGLSVVRITFPTTFHIYDKNGLENPGIGQELYNLHIYQHYINFNDPERYPELFDPSARREMTHLNERGTILLSRLAADYFVDEVLDREPELAEQFRPNGKGLFN